VPRVQGILAMSRALGDPGLKPFVSPEPRVVEGLLGRENDVAVIACDGVWDVMTTEEAVGLARTADDPEQGAAQIVRRALERGSTDNVTVIVLDLRAHTAELTRETMEIVDVLDYAAAAQRA
jgi:protein phosphatase 1L